MQTSDLLAVFQDGASHDIGNVDAKDASAGVQLVQHVQQHRHHAGSADWCVLHSHSLANTSSNHPTSIGEGQSNSPDLGGALTNPADQLPSLFGNSRFLREYPYSLPGFVIGGIAWTALLANAFFTKETLKRKTAGGATNEAKPMSTWEVLRAPGVGTVLMLYL